VGDARAIVGVARQIVAGHLVELFQVLRAERKRDSFDRPLRHGGLAAELLAIVIEGRQTVVWSAI